MNEHQELFDQVNEAIRHLNARIGGEGINSGLFVDMINDALGEAGCWGTSSALPILNSSKESVEFILESINKLISHLEESKIDN